LYFAGSGTQALSLRIWPAQEPYWAAAAHNGTV